MEEVKQKKPLETYPNVKLTYRDITYKYYTIRTGMKPFEN